MLINWHHLRTLPVVTESGRSLGRIVDWQLDVDSQVVGSYLIRSGWLGQSYLIKPTQVKSIDRDCVVVADAAVKEPVSTRPSGERVKTMAPAVFDVKD